MDELKAVSLADMKALKGRSLRLTPRLRWAQVDRTTTDPARLQQAWEDIDTGDIEWRDVPVEIVATLPREQRR